jgi:acetyltransferase-like isoleucine patch superfamily enzyme
MKNQNIQGWGTHGSLAWFRDRLAAKLSIAWHSTVARLLFRIMKCPVGPNLVVDGPLYLRMARPQSISLGQSVSIRSRFASNLIGMNGPSILDTLGGGRISIGDFTGMSSVVISSRAEVKIGSYVKFGPNVRIYDTNFHSLDWERRRSFAKDQEDTKSSPIEIGDDVFVGANVLILKGSVIGARAIIGAGAVVSGCVPADCMAIGNPAMIRDKVNQ